jgi:hypothetical protein
MTVNPGTHSQGVEGWRRCGGHKERASKRTLKRSLKWIIVQLKGALHRKV